MADIYLSVVVPCGIASKVVEDPDTVCGAINLEPSSWNVDVVELNATLCIFKRVVGSSVFALSCAVLPDMVAVNVMNCVDAVFKIP